MSKFFSLAYLTLPNTHPVDQIEIAAQCGISRSYVSRVEKKALAKRTISQHLPGEPDYALANGRMFQMVRAALERTGVRLMDIELARVADGVDVMSYEKEFALGAELASDEQGAARLTGKISEEDVAFLEGVVDKCTETTGKQTHFVIPGVDPASAALHVARTIVRRAERHVVALV